VPIYHKHTSDALYADNALRSTRLRTSRWSIAWPLSV
jgi:hypothetical protein